LGGLESVKDLAITPSFEEFFASADAVATVKVGNWLGESKELLKHISRLTLLSHTKVTLLQR